VDTRDRLCLALDTADLSEARWWAAAAAPYVGWVKVGLQLFSAYGPNGVRQFSQFNQKVFLDLKFHDIPNTVASAISEVAGLGAAMVNVHSSGGHEMIRRARESLDSWSEQTGETRPRLLAVTVLTSIDANALEQQFGIERNLEDLVQTLALDARAAGADGVIASAAEARSLKQLDPTMYVVTPGIRPVGVGLDDQRRATTPGEAILAGSDLLVIGRPISDAIDPRVAAKSIFDEVEQALGTMRPSKGPEDA
jgi:orotidine-5'-phosphate decarboxylase